jgi:hypothetical protein
MLAMGSRVAIESHFSEPLLMRPTKVLVSKLDHNMLDIDMEINANVVSQFR